jgi:poly(A) polymerase
MDGVPQPPEYHPEGDVLTHTCMVLDEVPDGDPVLAWSAVLHDVGKPRTFERAADRIRFSGHDVLSAQMADAALRRLHASNVLRETVVEISRDHIRFASLPEMTPARRERWLRSERFPAHLAFHGADCRASHGKLDIWTLATRWLAELPPLPPPPLCSGKDVLALGVAEGPLVGAILKELERRLDELPGADRALAVSILAEVAAPYVKPAS